MSFLDIPNTDSISSVSDWVELFIQINDEISKSDLCSYIEESSGSEPKESEIDDVWLELQFREQLYGENPPFDITEDIAKNRINWREFPEYMTCLIFSLVGNPTETIRSGKLFERITREAAKNYVSGESIACGSPPDLKAKDLSEMILEQFVREPPSIRRDRNLDVVAWKSFDDKRCSKIILLIQCAAGTTWKSKLKELNERAWQQYIHFACKPIKGFSMPVLISNNKEFHETSLDGGLIFDRSRIYRNIISVQPNDNLRTDLLSWCLKRLREIGINEAS